MPHNSTRRAVYVTRLPTKKWKRPRGEVARGRLSTLFVSDRSGRYWLGYAALQRGLELLGQKRLGNEILGAFADCLRY